MKIYSFSPFGYEGVLVTVEVDFKVGFIGVDIVGLADSAIKESRERMASAINNSDITFPPARILINLSPADQKKEGAGFDLPLALSLLFKKEKTLQENPAFFTGEEKPFDNRTGLADFNINKCTEDPILIMGELELSGAVRGVRGVNAAASSAFSKGISKCIVPKVNEDEARAVSGMRVYGAVTLTDAFEALSHPEYFLTQYEAPIKEEGFNDVEVIEGVEFLKVEPGYDYVEIKGQKNLVRALQIAAAGGHNLIAIGSPGCGKTMAIQKFPSLLPLLTLEESQSVTRIMSLAGLLSPDKPRMRIAPFRSPHQSASMEGICGGGPNCTPGELSLAHNGVLFLDEAAEFKPSVLQTLRIPLETGTVTIARAGRSSTYPASFQLLMASNPCPCGNYGSTTKICLCNAKAIENYWKKFSAPLIDRIDLRVPVASEASVPSSEKTSTSTAELRPAIALAIRTARERQGKRNARLTNSEVAEFCKIDSDCHATLDMAEERYGFSPRSITSILKTSRTIADMAGEKSIQKEHLLEAIKYKKAFTNFMDMNM